MPARSGHVGGAPGRHGHDAMLGVVAVCGTGNDPSGNSRDLVIGISDPIIDNEAVGIRFDAHL